MKVKTSSIWFTTTARGLARGPVSYIYTGTGGLRHVIYSQTLSPVFHTYYLASFLKQPYGMGTFSVPVIDVEAER